MDDSVSAPLGIAAIDFETFYDTKSGYSLRALTPHAYTHDSRFDPYLVAIYGDNGIKFTGNPKDFDWAQLDGWLLLAHNMAFDGMVLRRLIELGKVPQFRYTEADTADLAAYLLVPRNLAGAAKQLLGITVDKKIRGDMDGKTLADAMAEGFGPALIEYAGHDAELCYKIWKQFGGKMPACEQEYARINREAGWRGVRIDRAAVEDGVVKFHEILKQASADMPWVKAGEKALSGPAFSAHARAVGIPGVPASLKRDNPTMVKWVEEHSPAHPFIKARLDYASVTPHMARLQAMLSLMDDEDVLRFDVLYHGAHCVTGDHEVLTPSGWVRIDEWGGGDIMQWSKDGSLRFDSATPNRFLNETESNSIVVDSPYYKARMTLGHTVPTFKHPRASGDVTFDPRTAESLLSVKSDVRVPVSGSWEANAACGITPEQMRVLVATQADGHWVTDPKEGRGLTFTLRRPRKIERIHQILSAAGVPFRDQVFPSSPTQHRISIRYVDLPSWLSPDRKVFGPWLLGSSYEARVAMLDELVHWDGNSLPGGGVEYGSVVKQNVEWVSTVAQLTGRKSGALSTRPAAGNSQEFFRTTLRNRVNSKTCSVRVYRKQISRGPFSRVVYCPTTKAGFWMFRYKGVIGITGNTGRSTSNSGGFDDSEISAKFNPLNQPKKPVFGVDIRATLIPRKGRKFAIYDACQIEARLNLWMSGATRMLELIKRDGNLYQAYAKLVGWFPQDEKGLKLKNPALYAQSKVSVLGLGYGMGVVKFYDSCKKAGLNLSMERCGELVPLFRTHNSEIVNNWYNQQRALRLSAINKDPTHEIVLPSGRIKTYWDPEIRISAPDETGKPPREEIWCAVTKGAAKRRYWGGMLVENICQATSRDILRDGILGVYRAHPSWEYVFNAYDEVIFEIPDEDCELAKIELPRLLCDIPWAKGCPLEVEGGIFDHYTK